ncbi:MAG: hypothetical protein HZA24_11115 [Nitrospirae bacterium]|nr:hypothetical protein [Nitrospirota bacterium]
MSATRCLFAVAAVALAVGGGWAGPAADPAVDRPWGVAPFAGEGVAGFRDGPREAARFNWPTAVAVTPDWSVYVADFGNHRIRRVDPGGRVTTLAGSGADGFADGTGPAAAFSGPNGLALGPDGALYVADAGNARIRRVALDGAVTTVAGDGVRGVRDGPAARARFVYPTGLAFDRKGLLYVVDRWANNVRVVTPEGVVGTLAGDGTPALRDGPGPVARFNNPLAAVWDTHWGLVVADSGNHALRRVGPDAVVTTLAGGPEPGTMDGPADVAAFAWNTGLVGDGEGGFFVSDAHNHRIRHMSHGRDVSTVAGTGVAGERDGPAEVASFRFITGIARDLAGNLLVADSGAHRIRRVVRGDAQVVRAGPGIAVAAPLADD